MINRTDVAVVVPSFNRPKLLAEALSSIQWAAQIVVADDGSEFDVQAVLDRVDPDIELEMNPPIAPDIRMICPRTGALINRALSRVRYPLVAYLCDDDVFTPHWLIAVAAYFADHPEAHMVRGDWNTLGTAETCFKPPNEWVLTTGNFVHRTTCAFDEHCWWPTRTLSSHDGWMLTDYMRMHGMVHGGHDVPHTGVLAGWRREHAYNMLAHSRFERFLPSARALFEGGWLEP